MNKLILFSLVLLISCADHRNAQLTEYQFDISIESGFEYIPNDVKNKYHKDLDEWNKNDLFYKTIFSLLAPNKPSSVKMNNGLNFECNGVKYGILPGEYALKIVGYDGADLMVIDCDNKYKLLSLGQDHHLVMKLYSGKNILIYPHQNIAQQGDAPETSAIKNPTPCSVASLLPPRLGIFNSTGPGDL